jgi:hypothetical protein
LRRRRRSQEAAGSRPIFRPMSLRSRGFAAVRTRPPPRSHPYRPARMNAGGRPWTVERLCQGGGRGFESRRPLQITYRAHRDEIDLNLSRDGTRSQSSVATVSSGPSRWTSFGWASDPPSIDLVFARTPYPPTSTPVVSFRALERLEIGGQRPQGRRMGPSPVCYRD